MAETAAVAETPIYQEVREALGDPWPAEPEGETGEAGPTHGEDEETSS